MPQPIFVIPHPNINLENNTIDTGNNLNYDLSTMYLFLYGERNNYRTRAFHKLDISLTKNFLIKRRFQSSFSVGLYNAYNQLNPFMYNVAVKRNSDGTYRPVLNSVSVFPIMPSFSIRMKF
ncbi:MAG: outer rane receptor protein [Bacteroidetes bacterium]|nr:outer rane receptor protein [Bacteroidota bacterium]